MGLGRAKPTGLERSYRAQARGLLALLATSTRRLAVAEAESVVTVMVVFHATGPVA